MSFVKNTLPKAVLSASIIIAIASYLLSYQPLDNIVTTLLGYAVIIIAFSLPVGAINLIGRSVNNIRKRGKDWYLNVWMLSMVAIVSIAGVFFSVNNQVYQWIYQNVSQPVGATLTALPAFFVVSAAYRAFRGRSYDSVLLLGCAVIVMLYNAPIGASLIPPVGDLGKWLSDYPQTTGSRIIFIGWGIGIIALCVRYIFGREGITGGDVT